ncbi:UNVERIFIED_CONTAM: hypothetical protein FKN15_005781 [Acipenser sinensis]
MARPPHSNTPGVPLQHKIEARELEAFSSSPSKLPPDRALSEMYLEENRTSATVNYLDNTYEFAAAAAAPLYNPSNLVYHSAPLEPHSSASEGNLHSRGNVPTSPLVFMPSNPQLSSFIHHHHHHSRQIPYYLENDQGSYRLREATPEPIFRPSMEGRYQGVREQLSDMGQKGSPSSGPSKLSKEMRFCAVCSDYASGYHYGVWSCEGCKAFFKRSIQGHNDYMCPATNQCTIDKNRRKSCQACRLRKCNEVGMMKGGVRKDRRGRHMLKVKRTASEQDEKSHVNGHDRRLTLTLEPTPINNGKKNSALGLSIDQVLIHLLEAEPPTQYSKQKQNRPYTESSMMNILTSLADKELVHMIAWAKKIPGVRKDRRGRHMLKVKRTASEQDEKSHVNGHDRRLTLTLEPTPINNGKKNSALGLSIDQVLIHLLEAEPPTQYSKQKQNRPYTESSMMNILTSLADKELVHMIAWAKKIPGFVDLSLHDQVQLLECSWLEILMIGLIWRSVEFPGKLIFAPDLSFDRLNDVEREDLATERGVAEGAFPFLSNSMETLNDSQTIQLLLDKITDTLIHVIAKSGLPPQQQSRRQAQLLLLLSHIRHMSIKGMEHLYNMKCKNIVPPYDLLLEMLDAHRLHCPGDSEPEKRQVDK